ncbi:MAG TPA: hypothetical protein VK463_11665 [Desulfomonilaceae bacterium]|nr:hypothetical protein [Desulfomonilaceae bacterium]
MIKDAFGIAIITLVYLCLLIVVFSPSLYAAWIYMVSRKVTSKKTGRQLRIALSTFCINLIIAYFLFHFAFDYFLTSKVAQMEAMTQNSIQNAITSQQKFFAAHGRYYSVGPVRGPYRDENGLSVEKDVILQVEPRWDKADQKETFQAYAFHLWGKHLLLNTRDGRVEQVSPGSELETRLRLKLTRSVK